jgi:hypothetical protein
MPKLKTNRAREQRIELEIVVDAYSSEERAMGWYYYLEEKLGVPFQARVSKELPVSPLSLNEQVEVLGVAPEEVCTTEMFVWVRQPKRKLAVPLSQLAPLGNDQTINEAVADWHYWVNQGYQF